MELSDSKILSVKNEKLRKFMTDIKDEESKKSVSCDDVTSMIFSKASTHNVQEQLMASIRESELKK